MWFRNGHPTRGDVLFSTVGTIGNVAFVSENRGCIAQNLIAIRSDKTKLSGEFLYYYLSQKKQKNMLIGLDIGSVQSSIKVPHLLSLKVKFPKLEVQIKVTKILSSIDNKIELNNKINKSLEEMAQAIFKSWFVDFEPFKDEEFVDSDLGSIPKGWRTDSLTSLAEFLNGLAMQKYRPNSEKWLPVIKIRELNQGFADEAN